MKKFTPKKDFDAIVIGCSAGGMAALTRILPFLPRDFPSILIIVLHRHMNADDYLIRFFRQSCCLAIKEIEDKDPIESGVIYFAPPNYHVLIEQGFFALSIEKKVNYSRPSIDVLFESAAAVYQNRLIGIILSGANNDGCQGLQQIKNQGGLTIVQTPLTAENNFMPQWALDHVEVDYVYNLESILAFLLNSYPNEAN